MRAFDSSDRGTRAVMADAPKLLDRLTVEDAEHFAQVRALLDDSQVAYELDPTLVRGLDYYTRTLFEFTSDALGAQSGVGGGGRYDRLIEQLDGKPTPACGWAAGVERILLSAGELPLPAEIVDLFVARAPDALREAAFALARDARRAGLAAQLELAGRSLKGQLKQADRVGARYVAIVETGEEVSLKRDGDRPAAGARRRGGHPDDPPRGAAVTPMQPPRPNDVPRPLVGELTAAEVGETVRVAGWVHRRRDHGGLIFIDLRDRTGVIQLVFHPTTAPDAHAAAHALRAEDVITVTGAITRRDEANVNPALATGEIELTGRRAWRSSPTPRRRRSRSTRAQASTRRSVCATARSICAATGSSGRSRCATP